MHFQKPLSVIIPIFNGYDHLIKLLFSLEETFPNPCPLLNFHFIDDCSTDNRNQLLFTSHPFFKRTDVFTHLHKGNEGFVKTINSGFDLINTNDDVIILNTDTLIYGNAFQILQNTSMMDNRIASITPLTNCGTIASLWNWPEGIDNIQWISAKEINISIERQSIKTPLIETPTGVGFCMYITCKALNAIGKFDSDNFRSGYGEENDWCQRAQKLGYINIICTETFVYHSNHGSFQNEQRSECIKNNELILIKKHPSYHLQIKKYIQSDPLARIRCQLSWCIRNELKKKYKLKTITYITHNDPYNYKGGTEQHVKYLTDIAQENNNLEVFHLFPLGINYWRIRCLYMNQTVLEYCFNSENVTSLLDLLLDETDTLHVHHLKGLNEPFISQLIRSNCIKIITLHDFLFLCPSIHLTVKNTNGIYNFCGLPLDTHNCNKCLKNNVGYTAEDIESYRRKMLLLLNAFHTIIVPSRKSLNLFKEGYLKFPLEDGKLITLELLNSIFNKIKVIKHPLPFLNSSVNFLKKNDILRETQKMIVFLGGIELHKGSELISPIAKSLINSGYKVEVWGYLSKNIKFINKISYKSWMDLLNLVSISKPSIIIIPSVCPETFCFTLYEALCVIKSPVIVGPFGNPSDVVDMTNTGVVIQHISKDEFILAIDKIENNYEYFKNNVSNFNNNLLYTQNNKSIEEIFNLYLPTTNDRKNCIIEFKNEFDGIISSTNPIVKLCSLNVNSKLFSLLQRVYSKIPFKTVQTAFINSIAIFNTYLNHFPLLKEIFLKLIKRK